MIKIVKPEKPYVPKHGDIDIYGKYHEYLLPLDWNEIAEKNPMPLIGTFAFSMNPWKALIRAGVDELDIKRLKRWSKNYCPCADMNYFAIVPVALLATDSTVYTGSREARRGFFDSLNDAEWNRNCWLGEDGDGSDHSRNPEEHLSSIHRAMLGSGYHDSILPCDGGHSLIYAAIPLENGDKIIVVGWEWYNK